MADIQNNPGALTPVPSGRFIAGREFWANFSRNRGVYFADEGCGRKGNGLRRAGVVPMHDDDRRTEQRCRQSEADPRARPLLSRLG